MSLCPRKHRHFARIAPRRCIDLQLLSDIWKVYLLLLEEVVNDYPDLHQFQVFSLRYQQM
jgi:hypothetical protein